MTRVLHTARISNVEIIKCVVNNKDGKSTIFIYHLYYLLQGSNHIPNVPLQKGKEFNYAYDTNRVKISAQCK